MTPFIRNMFVVARRDFLAIVATPTFLLFLLAPLFMIGLGAIGVKVANAALELGMTEEDTRFNGFGRECGIHLDGDGI